MNSLPNFTFTTHNFHTLSDIHSPVECYLKIRDVYPNAFLLESSDHKSRENSFSYLCFQPIASFQADMESSTMRFPDHSRRSFLHKDFSAAHALDAFSRCFSAERSPGGYIHHGLFGYTSYQAIPLFESISMKAGNPEFPLIQYHVFRYVAVFNHFNNELHLYEHLLPEESSQLEAVKDLLLKKVALTFPFRLNGTERSHCSDEDYLSMIRKGIHHCLMGDVFQIVLSRKYSIGFQGDDFNVYRSLRSVNPSPYLFYFDYGHFRLMGSSPEAQLTIQGRTAAIHPIAGTFRRTGNMEQDMELATALSADPKENAEHVMLVDLARNDLSKHSREVHVVRLKEIEFYSHVIHLVSKVEAQLPEVFNPVEILGDTYPAGTLSGAPKYRAMQLIDEYEPEARMFYGGAVGFMGFDGSFNHAIFIRSFVSHRQQLTYQAGAGIVAVSSPESELQEVHNKLGALRKALERAQRISS